MNVFILIHVVFKGHLICSGDDFFPRILDSLSYFGHNPVNQFLAGDFLIDIADDLAYREKPIQISRFRGHLYPHHIQGLTGQARDAPAFLF